MKPPRPFKLPPKPCKSCNDTGLIPLQNMPDAKLAWHSYFTTAPCLCPLGDGIRKHHQESQAEYGEAWADYCRSLQTAAVA